ncbi:hypothetical protein K1Y82_16195 [Bacillus inaquosorum]|uniref:hypothetical protein n=1 Tax=Bacillus inaquosorum TaxID=483913 RepID=UPI000A1095FB|nr:hypothetical protein [Bacillus inaquosorum]QJC89998.1 hypothetical protein HC662_31920 [Bacillus subtilis]QYX42704.1 hypothetical protein K1Y82_16195 [Bacillus inaquosorum]WNW23162.1 hypothetical protein RS399_15630 [Bacillus inaquosorum]
MTWTQFFVILLTALITAIMSNLFSFIKEKMIASSNTSSRYTEDILSKLYVPLYRLITKGNYTLKGYYGLTPKTIFEMKKIIDQNPELCEPGLERLIAEMYEEARKLDGHYGTVHMKQGKKVDENGELYIYIINGFNTIRRNLGLPSERKKDKLHGHFFLAES